MISVKNGLNTLEKSAITADTKEGVDLTYEELLEQADERGLIVKEKNLKANAGRIKGNRIAIHRDMTSVEKSCILAEELGHHYTTIGDILDQDDSGNRKQELRARLWAYNNQIGLRGIIRAYEAHLTELYEVAEFLEVTPEFLSETLQCYRSKYSPYTTIDNYAIFFEPSLSVMKLI